MNKHKSYYIAVLLILFHCISFAQTEISKRRTATRAFVKCDDVFPKCFIGNWKGELQWMVNGKPTQTFTMQLRIQPTNSANQYTWQIIYSDEAKDDRPYILKLVDTPKATR